MTIEEQARVSIPTELPVVVGNAGNGWARLTFLRTEFADVVTCHQRVFVCEGYIVAGDIRVESFD